MSKIRVLHIGVHLGGGIGRALSPLASHRRAAGSLIEDVFVCLERPKNFQFVEAIAATGAELYVAPGPEDLTRLIATADVVQLEWWHHPLLAGWIHQWKSPAARLVIWAHISGLHYPVIPREFTHLPHAFLPTSKVSLGPLERDDPARANILEVINSTGGFDEFPQPVRSADASLHFGYLGSLNPAKLHPEIVSFLSAVRLPDFLVDFYGDPSANARLASLAGRAVPRPRFALRGYTDRPARVLSDLDVLVYLLNPTHYGTTENALLEAMACGVVPVVLNNPVEQAIVEHGRTGLVVDSPGSFADAIHYLVENPEERLRLSRAGAAAVREQYSVRKTVEQLDSVYLRVMDQPKRSFDFGQVFGNSPADWFQSCLGSYKRYFAEEADNRGREERLRYPFFYEETKSSAFHFFSQYPADSRLAHWAEVLHNDLAAAR